MSWLLPLAPIGLSVVIWTVAKDYHVPYPDFIGLVALNLALMICGSIAVLGGISDRLGSLVERSVEIESKLDDIVGYLSSIDSDVSSIETRQNAPPAA